MQQVPGAASMLPRQEKFVEPNCCHMEWIAMAPPCAVVAFDRQWLVPFTMGSADAVA
jgi:hypothetical protein